MTKMVFAKTVRYEGAEYTPNRPFEVKDDDVEALKKSGGWLIEKSGKATSSEEKLEAEEEIIDQSKSKIEALRERAIELGIDFKGNWGVKRLMTAIAEAEQI